MNTPLLKVSVKLQAQARELEVLKAIGLNGWITTRLLGLWVWQLSNVHTATNKALLVLNRLYKAKYVAKRETPEGVTAWILTRTGADKLNAQLIFDGYERGWGHHGYDIGLLDFTKTMINIEYLVKKIRQQDVEGAIGKSGIRAGIIPLLKDADGAYIKKQASGGYTVIGVLAVTNAREGIQKKLKKLLAQNQLIDLAGDARIVATLRQRIGV